MPSFFIGAQNKHSSPTLNFTHHNTMPSKKKKASLRAPLQQQPRKKKRARPQSTNKTSKGSSTSSSLSNTTKKQRTEKSGKRDAKTMQQQQHQQQQQHNTLSNSDAIEVGSKALRLLVNSHAHLCYLGSGKVQCSVTSHEMLPKEDVVRQHLSSKRYSLTLGYQKDYDHLLPWIQPHPEDHRKLSCTLTGHELNKIPSQLELHTTSKRFLRLKKEGEEKLRLKEEKLKRKEVKRKERAASRAAKAAAAASASSDNTTDELLPLSGSSSSSSDSGSSEDSDSDGEDEEEADAVHVAEDGNKEGTKDEDMHKNKEEVEKEDDEFSWILRSR